MKYIWYLYKLWKSEKVRKWECLAYKGNRWSLLRKVMGLFPQKVAWDYLKRQSEIATTSKTETKINDKKWSDVNLQKWNW